MYKFLAFLLSTFLLALVFVLAAFVWPAFLVDRTGRALIGKPVVNSIRNLVAPEDLTGTSFILISDMYNDECNKRHSEFSDLIVQLNTEGTAARMLHVGSHGSPNESYEEAVNAKRAPTHVVIADSAVAYANEDIRRLQKPCLLQLVDGEVVEVRIGTAFEEWISKQ